jgi:hypothetical protein
MQDLLHRLYKTRLALLAVLLMVAGLGLMFIAPRISSSPDWNWLSFLQLPQLGFALLTAGLVSIAWQYFTQEVSEQRTRQLFLSAITEQAPAIRDAVIQGFAFNADDLARVTSPDTLDQIARNTLALQLGDENLATAAYADLRQQVIRSPERRHDAVVSVDLAPWNDLAASEPMFVATVRWEYRTIPAEQVMRFACISDKDEYRDLLQDPTSALAWFFKPVGELHGGSAGVFELVAFTVEGKSRPIRRTQRAKGQSYSVNLSDPKAADSVGVLSTPREVTISYTYRVLVRQHGHLLSLNIGSLTKGLKVAFRYGGCGIREVNALDFIASAEPARLSQTPTSVPTPTVEVSFDGWVWARSGVAFSWVLETESNE